MKKSDYKPIKESLLKDAIKQIAESGKLYHGIPKRPTKAQLNKKFKIHKKEGKFTILEE